jgi:inosine-uridine nucleoside N-ribohydrolase
VTEGPRPPRRIHVDADPGLGDLLALAVALGSRDLQLVGVTTVAGRAPLAAVSENAQRFLALAGADVPLGIGCAGPLELAPLDAVAAQGSDGRLGVSIPALDRRPLRSAREVLLESLGARGAEVIVALGPLGNLADLVAHAPLALAGAEIIWRGGALGPGDATPLAEFNCCADPIAAMRTLERAPAARALRVLPLEVTAEVRLPADALPPLGAGARSRVVADICAALQELERPFQATGVPLDDACAVLAAGDPELFRWGRTVLEIDASAGRERGRMSERPFGFGPRIACAGEAHREELCRRAGAALGAFCASES